MPAAPAVTEKEIVGPHASYIHVAQQYIFQQQLQGQLVAIGTNPTREDAFRLQGVQWINDVRIHLQLPIRTFDTAVNYYHKFRLVHKDSEYQYYDAAAAALLTACKIEDTLKKSKEILCAAHNLKVSPAEYLSPDDNTFEGPSKIAIGLERLMLEASGFDFRVRYPQKHLIKLCKEARIDKDVSRVAYNMLIDLYKTFAPIKVSCAAMAFACIELATLVLEKQHSAIHGERSPKYRRWRTSRAEVIEAILDLLDLYTHFQKSSIVGPGHAIEKFLQIRLKLNQEVEHHPPLTRYTQQHEALKTNGHKLNVKTPKTPVTPASPADVRLNGTHINGTNGKDNSPATMSPRSSGSSRKGAGARGQEGTVRFMLGASEAKQEKEIVDEYFKVEYEEYEIEIEEKIRPERKDLGPPPGPGGQRSHPRDGRNDRSYYHNKRVRR